MAAIVRRLLPSGRVVLAGGRQNFLPQQLRGVVVVAQDTPNPESVIFKPEGCDVLGDGIKTIKFSNKYDTNDSPLAAAIFKVKGVQEILLASAHVTVTKKVALEWEDIQENVELVISQFYAAGLKPLKEGVAEREAADVPQWEEGTIEASINELLEERVRPFVQQDGGDIEYVRFNRDDGILYVTMQGACNGCSKSEITLQVGIKNMMQHYCPEVLEIVNTGDEEEEYIPRAGGRDAKEATW